MMSFQLAMILLYGMEAIKRHVLLTGPDLIHSYTTHFPMPDGQIWKVQLTKLESVPTDAR